jgi:hypothetical protein
MAAKKVDQVAHKQCSGTWLRLERAHRTMVLPTT